MKIGIIGCGVIGTAFAKKFSKKHALFLYTRNCDTAKEIAKQVDCQSASSLKELVKKADQLILAVKPQDLTELARELSPLITATHTLLSPIAGTSLKRLRDYFPKGHLMRILPNLPIKCGSGIIGISTAPPLPAAQRKQYDTLFSPLGKVFWLKESLLNPLTALSGSGPAFLLVAIEAMSEAAIRLGFSQEQALEITLETMKGTAQLVEAEKVHPAELKWQITSPAGVTINGLSYLEKSGFRSGLDGALQEAYRRTEELNH